MRKSIFTNIVKKDDVYVLHNTLYNTSIKIISERFKHFINTYLGEDKMFYADEMPEFSEYIEVLFSQKMITYDNIDENSIVNMLYTLQPKKTLNIILIVTRNCNFRCPYCYEEHTLKYMTQNTYTDAIDYIKNIVDIRKYENINISFFGGEPLLEYSNIIIFMKNLQQKLGNAVRLRGQITTNGYLLSQHKFLELIKAGVDSYQITIDGMKATHNQTRILANGSETWDKIINNLKEIAKIPENFSIVIRTNFTSEIIASSDEWLAFLAKSFGKDKRFTYHFEAVKNLGVDSIYKTHTAQEEGKDIAQIIKRSKKIGLNLDEYKTKLAPFSLCCYASNIDSFVIDYDGTLKKCSVCIDDEKNNIGKLDALGTLRDFREDRFAWWTSYNPHPECLSCSIYPLCFGKKCPNGYFSKDMCDTLKQTYYATINEIFD